MIPTSCSGISSVGLLANVPESLRDELLEVYAEIVTNYRERRWEPSELNGGKLCEVVYTILRGHVDGLFPAKSTKPPNMVDACRSLEMSPLTFPRSIRVQVPRMLTALYEVRNNRGVGHVGSDVDPSQMDATCVLYMSKWVMSELVRIFHGVSTEAAEAAIEGIVERTVPCVWRVGSNLRILDTKATMKEKTLILLYHSAGPVHEHDLVTWIEHSNPTVFRRDVLRALHRDKLAEFDDNTRLVYLSPKGVAHVEAVVLPKVSTRG